MATPPVPKFSNGDVLKQSKAKAASKKSSKKPFKSNITNKIKSAGAVNSVSADTAESDDDESDSSAIEEHDDSNEGEAVFALSNGRQQSGSKAGRRLAGPRKNEDTTMNDDVQATAGAEHSTDDDDDDQYADVEDISDSDVSDDGDITEKDVRRAAESDLIGEFERSEQRRESIGMTNAIHDMALNDEAHDIALAKELSLQDSHPPIDFDFEVNMDDDPFVGLNGDDSTYKAMWDEAEMAMWRRPGSGSPQGQSNAHSGTQKRVRFEEVVDTPSRVSSPASSADEDAGDAFPDLFASLDDPTIQQQLALDVEDDNGLLPYDWGDTESCYDFDGEEENLAFQLDEEDDSNESDDDTLNSDSEDGGDTTDEETEEEQRARLQERRTVAAKTKYAPVTPTPSRVISRAGSTPSTPRPSTPKTGCRGPQMGTFAKDPSRAIITNDSVAKRTKIEPPSNPPEDQKAFWENARRARLKPSGSRRGSGIGLPGPGYESIPDRPFTAKSTLGTMFNGNLDLLRNNESSESEPVFFPPQLSNAQQSFTGTTATEDSDDDIDINMQDFIEMSDTDSNDGRPLSSHVDSPSESEMYSSQNMGMENSSSGLLSHFELDRGLVGSFRRNQQHTKHFSSLASHPAKRASAHEYNALQKGRRGAANTPMTPARKKRASQDLTQNSAGVRKSINSPLAARRPRSRGNSIASKSQAGLYETLTQSPF